MPGSIDTNGVYQYAEDDLASPFSDVLNLGMESVSEALAANYASLAARLADLETDTGWVPLTLASGYSSGSGFAIRKVGKSVRLRGSLSVATNWGAAGFNNVVVTAANGIPTALRPSNSQAFACDMDVSGTPITPARVAIGSDGSISVRPGVASSTGMVWATNVGYFTG